MIYPEITVDLLREDGETVSVMRTVYETEFGPVMATERLLWTAERASAFAAPNPAGRRLQNWSGLTDEGCPPSTYCSD